MMVLAVRPSLARGLLYPGTATCVAAEARVRLHGSGGMTSLTEPSASSWPVPPPTGRPRAVSGIPAALARTARTRTRVS
jgi:hypothetical protein